MILILTVLSAVTFIFYGVLCLTTNHMKEEFKRYGFEKFRILTGWLELLGGVGLLVGLQYKPILLLSSCGLATLMLMGAISRIRVRDPFLETIPALSLMIINAYIFIMIISL